jgi:hypothetical protein
VAIRREELFQFFNKSQFRLENQLARVMPRSVASVVASPAAILRPLVRSDPILRAMLSDNIEARRALVDLAETPLQYKINEQGQTVTTGGVPVELAIKARRNTELAQSLGSLQRSYVEYMNDGDASLIGRASAPIVSGYRHLLNEPGKLSQTRFNEEVGLAAMSGDVHPIPQVQKAAQEIRAKIFERAKEDAIAVGIFDPDLQLKFADSYFMRVYDVEKIQQNLRNGTADDMTVELERAFKESRDEAQRRLENDDTVERVENDLFQLKEAVRGNARALRKARKKAVDQRNRADAAIKRENKVSRVTGALSRAFKNRAQGLKETVMEGEALEVFKDMIADVRGIKRLEPTDILGQIRSLGGIRDPRAKNQWKNGDWISDGTRTEIEDMFNSRANSIRRDDGLEVDYMREALVELGYLDEGASVADFMDILARASKGEKIYSKTEFPEDLARFEAAQAFAAELDRLNIDPSLPIEKIIQKIPGYSKSQKITKAKAGEAARSGRKADEAGGEGKTLFNAMDRLEDAKARLDELDTQIGPKVRAENKKLTEEIKDVIKKLGEARKARSSDEFYASKDDLEITEAVDDAVRSIIGLNTGEHSYVAAMSSPTKARVLDVHDKVLAPWLEKDIGVITAQYFNSIIPDIEMARMYGGKDLPRFNEAVKKIEEEGQRLANKAKTAKEKKFHVEEAKRRVIELMAMRDRITGRYGVPKDPKTAWVRGARTIRTLSYMGYLGGMTLSAIPDVANVIGRNGIEAAFGGVTALTDPKRMGLAMKDAGELGAAAEWYLNTRASAIADIMDDYGQNTRFERGLAGAANTFGKATGMIQWNAGWKTVGSAFISSKMSKAAVAVKNGKATKKDLLKLSENGIDTVMAQRIADQMERHGDMDGQLWLPQARNWDDPEAFEAFKNAMNREMDIMIVTPGQDKPIAWSTEVGKFFSQFKSFSMSAHHRILLSGMQRADAEVLAQFTTAVILGGFVSRTKAYLGGYEQKEGAAFWEDSIDRSGLAGWLMEAHGIGNALSGGRLSISGEETSRFAARSALAGLMGPGVDMTINFGDAVAATNRGEMSVRDGRNLLRPVPGNNLPYMTGLFRDLAETMSEVNKD